MSNSATVTNKTQYKLSLILLALMFLPVWLDYSLVELKDRQLKGSDIYHIWTDGKEIAAGQNPYAKIHGSDMLHNQKYSTYLPGFFLLETLLVKTGVSDFDQFFPFWRFFVTALFCLIGLLIFEMVHKKSGLCSLGLFAAVFWLWGRWSFSTLRIWQIDFLAIFFLLLSVYYLNSKAFLSYLLLGVSLSIKQIAVFVVPLYLIMFLTQFDRKTAGRNLFALSLAPVLVSLPFVIWDAKAYFMSLFFSVTRNPGGLKMETVDQVLGVVGVFAKVPLLLSLFLVYFLFFKAKISVSQAILLAFLSFVTFNSVLFKQYFPWAAAFIGLALAESLRSTDTVMDRDLTQGKL